MPMLRIFGQPNVIASSKTRPFRIAWNKLDAESEAPGPDLTDEAYPGARAGRWPLSGLGLPMVQGYALDRRDADIGLTDDFDVIHPLSSPTPVFVGAMTQALSLYLDALRFGAAFTVFVSHWAGARYSGGLFWQLMGYGRTSVIVFFVLSGFVIAWVTETRERSFEDYAFSRIARLSSVIVPAFLLTAVLDRLATAIDSQLYGPEVSLGPVERFLGYALSLVFLGESWGLTMLPGFNVPFWSLNYEAWYYVLFGAALFLRGRRRIMAVAAVVAFAALDALGAQHLFGVAATSWLPFSFSAYDYVVGGLVAVFITALANTPLRLPGDREQRLIRWLAGTSFGLYLYHYPLLNFFGTVVPGSATGTMHGMLVFGLTLGVALPLAHLTEQWKKPMKRMLHSGFDAARRKYRDPATGGRGIS